MTATSEILDALHGIASRLDADMSEKDVENSFLNENFYTLLGYEGAGHDLRSEWTLPDDRRPDYVTLDTNESVTAVYEFKTTGRDLSPHEDQLFHYVDELKADYGVLTNGDELRLYRRDGHTRMLAISLEDATDDDAANLEAALQKPKWDITDPESVTTFLDGLEEVELNGELGQEHFFETFRLEENSPFADLVTAMMDLLVELRDEREEKFVKGAYDFWAASYASEPDETPDSWEPYIDGQHSLRDFMFCLESGHALLARLLLAKATEDHEFFRNTAYNGMDDYFRGLQGFSDNISLDAFPVAANGLIEDMEDNLVQSLFEDDIFVWWTDGYEQQISRSHETRANQFEAVARGTGKVTKISPATSERFSRAIAHVFFSVLKFDFSEIEGDLLGDLYQHYFDPETRKALGEFYTPQPVIDYIMDGVDYNVGVSGERLIDPSCGSGTFLVEAVHRYIEDVERYNDDPDWEKHLTDLCTSPHIVGLDIHPFAVLMAQIRFMVAILPQYRDAKEQNREFTIRRLPIYRTDTLRNERELTGIDLGDAGQTQMTLDAVTDDNQDVMIPVPLPIEVDESEVDETEDGFLVQRVRMPLYNTARLNADIHNFGEYFAALQGVLDVVKWYMEDQTWEYRGGLAEGIHRYTTQEYDGIEEFFAPYVDDILSTVRYLREDHGDGRLFKIFEDTVLALVVKNYMKYQYVVGNPPYVSTQNLPSKQKRLLEELYSSASGQFDLYCPFYERGIDWLSQEGKLGYITPNQYMVTEYGEGLREVIQSRTAIEQVQDFRDSGVFKDATNYPAIVILRAEEDEAARESNVIQCGRIKSNINQESGRDLDEAVVTRIRKHLAKGRYSDEYLDIFEFPQNRLSTARWPLMPEHEWEVFKKIEFNADARVHEVTEAVFQGIMTGSKSVFVVEVLDAERVTSEDKGGIVTIRPTGTQKEYKIETNLLRPFIDGKEVERWQVNWSGLHIVHPYIVESNQKGEEVVLIDEENLSENLPKTWEYLLEHEDTLKNRSSRGEGGWYGYSRPQNLKKFERPKIIMAKIANQATYMMDVEGTWYFTTPYSVLLGESHQQQTKEITAQLNSSVLDYYFKHIAAIKAGGYYEYLTQYVGEIPCIVKDSEGYFHQLRRTAEDIGDTLNLENKIDRFPEAYLGGFDGDLGYINYEWQTRRYPVDANIQQKTNGRFVVTAGRSDEISDPLIDRGNSEEKKLRAKFVHAAVDGRRMKKGEEQTIPIPQSQDGVEQLIDAWEADRQTVTETSIEGLEAEIDRTVYELFNLSKDERAIIEDYLEVF